MHIRQNQFIRLGGRKALKIFQVFYEALTSRLLSLYDARYKFVSLPRDCCCLNNTEYVTAGTELEQLFAHFLGTPTQQFV